MTIPTPAIPPVRLIAKRWLAHVLPSLQTGNALLTPVESWADDVFATVSMISGPVDAYVPVNDARVQIDVWGRPSPSQQYRGVPINRCDAIVNHLEYAALHSTPLLIDFSASNYANADLSYVEPEEKSAAVSERPGGGTDTGIATVALSRARLTVCFVYKIPI